MIFRYGEMGDGREIPVAMDFAPYAHLTRMRGSM